MLEVSFDKGKWFVTVSRVLRSLERVSKQEREREREKIKQLAKSKNTYLAGVLDCSRLCCRIPSPTPTILLITWKVVSLNY